MVITCKYTVHIILFVAPFLCSLFATSVFSEACVHHTCTCTASLLLYIVCTPKCVRCTPCCRLYSFITCCFLKTALHFGARLFRTPVLWCRHVLLHCVATSSLYTACDETCNVEARWSRHCWTFPPTWQHALFAVKKKKNAQTPNESRSESSAKYVCSWTKSVQ